MLQDAGERRRQRHFSGADGTSRHGVGNNSGENQPRPSRGLNLSATAHCHIRGCHAETRDSSDALVWEGGRGGSACFYASRSVRWMIG
jgi:hypothetical protein